MELYLSKRFLEDYERASLGLRNLAEGEVHTLITRYRADNRNASRHYDRLRHLDDRVLELKLGGSHRLLARYEDGKIVLLHFGEHEIVERYSAKMLRHDLGSYRPAPRCFWPEHAGFFKRHPDNAPPFHYPEEISPEWLYFLEAQQTKVEKKIFARLWKMLDSHASRPPPYFILGGPGTGKTCILLHLLRFFADADLCRTGIVLSDQLMNYIEQSTRADVARYRVTSYPEGALDVLLIDDPRSLVQIEQALGRYQLGLARALVVGFDPLQLDGALSDREFQAIVEKYGVQTYALKTCYRQKRNVGERTKEVIDKVATSSTPFLRQDKIEDFRARHRELTCLANEMEFVNPAGYVQYYEDASVAQIIAEVQRILRDERLMWRHSPGLLIVDGLAPARGLSPEALEALAPLKARGYVRFVTLDSVEQVKGLEFQHVFICLDLPLFNDIQVGFSGTGMNVYDRRRLLRIPFSRAKDSLVTFAFKIPSYYPVRYLVYTNASACDMKRHAY